MIYCLVLTQFQAVSSSFIEVGQLSHLKTGKQLRSRIRAYTVCQDKTDIQRKKAHFIWKL